MKTASLSIVLIALFLSALSCQQDASAPQQTSAGSNSESDNSVTTEEAPSPAPTEPERAFAQTVQLPEEKPVAFRRILIKRADYRFQVKSVDKATKAVEGVASKLGGFVSGMNMTNSNYEITNGITIRVPAERFDTLLAALGEQAIFTQYKRISTEDVSEEYVDIEIRLKTKKEVRDRYQDILRNKAKTVEDVLKAEEQIRIIQEEIESKEGRLRFLKNQVSLSTINLEIYQELDHRSEPEVYHYSFFDKAWDGLGNGWALVTNILLALVNIWPLLIIGVLVFWKRKWVFGRWRNRKDGEGPV